MPKENVSMQPIKKPEKHDQEKISAATPDDFYRPTLHLSDREIDFPEDLKFGQTMYVGLTVKVTSLSSSTNTRGKASKSVTLEIHEIGFDKPTKPVNSDKSEDSRPITGAYEEAEKETRAKPDDEGDDD